MSSAKASLVSVIGLCIAWAVSGSLMQPRKDGKRPASALTLWTRCCHPGEAGEVAKMSFPDAVLLRLVLIRVLPGLLIVVYLSVIIASHSVPLDSGLGTTMGLAGMFTVIVVLFVTA